MLWANPGRKGAKIKLKRGQPSFPFPDGKLDICHLAIQAFESVEGSDSQDDHRFSSLEICLQIKAVHRAQPTIGAHKPFVHVGTGEPLHSHIVNKMFFVPKKCSAWTETKMYN